jgi:hypothetical protein
MGESTVGLFAGFPFYQGKGFIFKIQWRCQQLVFQGLLCGGGGLDLRRDVLYIEGGNF